LAVREKLSAIEAKLGKKMQREMASLPEKYGYDGMESFIAALQELSGSAKPERKYPNLLAKAYEELGDYGFKEQADSVTQRYEVSFPLPPANVTPPGSVSPQGSRPVSE
jgi:hypothetical protein